MRNRGKMLQASLAVMAAVAMAVTGVPSAAGADPVFPRYSRASEPPKLDRPVGHFHTLRPSPVLDTVSDVGRRRPVGTGRMSFQVAGRGGVPRKASSVLLSVTARNGTKATKLTTWQAGRARPATWTVQARAGRTATNTAVVRLSPKGRVALHNAAGRVDVRVSVLGWYDKASSTTARLPRRAADLRPVQPARILDTRSGLGGRRARLAAGSTATVVVAGRGGVPSSATAVSLTVTAWRPTKETEVTAYQAGTSRPATPTLTPSAGRSVSTTTMVPLGAGKLRVWNRSGRTDVVVAVTGWYGKPTSNGAGIYAGTAQARILDTRSGVGGSRGRLGSGSSLALRVHGRGGVPAQASTALLQVTALSPSRSGHLTVWPDGVARPRALTSVAFSRQSETALVLARIGRGGRVRVHNSAGSTHVLVGVVGWYARSGANLSGQTSAAGVLGEVPLDSGTRRAAATGGHRLAQPVHLQGPPDVVARMKQAVRSGALEDFQAGVEQESQSPRTASAAAAYPNFAIWNAGYLQAPPGAPIGRLYSFVGEAWRGSCTATVIARGYVLTAAHCVTDRDGFTFVSSQFGDIDTSRQWFSRDAYVPNGYSDRSQGIGNAMDYAIVKFLPAANGSRWIGDYTGSHKVYMNSPGGTKWSFGYPGEGNFGTHCTGAKCYPYQCYSPVGAYELHRSDPSVSYGGWYTVGFGCYMTGGSSGGPIFEQINGSWYVVSVNSYLGNPAGTYGVAQGCTRPTGECYTYARNMWGPYINEMFNVFYRNVG